LFLIAFLLPFAPRLVSYAVCIFFITSLISGSIKDALKEVVQYGHSKRRSIEVTGADGNPIEVRLKLIDEISQAMSKLSGK
jgi:hypothetical protein